MYRAELTVKNDWYVYNVKMYKNNELLFNYNFETLTSAYKMIALFIPPVPQKETT